MLEIEAKFTVTDQAVFQRLIDCVELGGLQLAKATIVQVSDSYRDTAARDFLRAGYACRIRHQGSKRVATLKSLGIADGAVHSRRELQVALTARETPEEWPDSEARDLALSLGGDRPLTELFTVRQKRHVRVAHDGSHPAVEISIDAVHFITPHRVRDVLELEAELLPGGSMQHLSGLVGVLQQDWHLEPQRLSKFEHGLAILAEGG